MVVWWLEKVKMVEMGLENSPWLINGDLRFSLGCGSER